MQQELDKIWRMITLIPWNAYLAAIMDKGMTQVQVAEAIGCRQGTISAILSGKTTDPRYSIGMGLIALGRKKRVKGVPDHTGIVRSRKK